MAGFENTEQLDNYRIFVAIVEAGSFTKAAQKLAVPKSKLSRRLLQLEKQLGSQLMIRTTRKLALTEQGQLLYQESQPHIAALLAMETLVHDSQSQIKGTLKLLLPLEFFNQVIGELITTFALKYPELQIECQHYAGITPHYDHQYDLVFVLHEQSLPDSHWVSRSLLSFPQSIYYASAVEIAETDNLAMLNAIVSEQEENWLVRAKKGVKLIKPNITMILASPEMRVKACLQNIGVVKLPDYVGKRVNGIQALKGQSPLVAQQLSVLYHSRNIPHKTRVFLDFFQSQIGSLSSDT